MKLFDALLMSNSSDGENQYKRFVYTMPQNVELAPKQRAFLGAVYADLHLNHIPYSNVLAVSCDSTQLWSILQTGVVDIDITWERADADSENFVITAYAYNGDTTITYPIPSNTVNIVIIYK